MTKKSEDLREKAEDTNGGDPQIPTRGMTAAAGHPESLVVEVVAPVGGTKVHTVEETLPPEEEMSGRDLPPRKETPLGEVNEKGNEIATLPRQTQERWSQHEPTHFPQ